MSRPTPEVGDPWWEFSSFRIEFGVYLLSTSACVSPPPDNKQPTMAELTATNNAPKTTEDLRSLLANDNKVKVAG